MHHIQVRRAQAGTGLILRVGTEDRWIEPGALEEFIDRAQETLSEFYEDHPEHAPPVRDYP
jgi:hypothetical protein